MTSALAPLPQYRRAISRWLSLCIVLVMCMVVLGGVTRLTESGLSIVEWKLVSGTVPPMSDAAWQKEFNAYKTSPQYQKVNRDFALADFKQIFWLEYFHRLLGRIIGMVIIYGGLYFAIRKRLTYALKYRVLGLCLLVGAQGAVGWIMVASGLVDAPRVAPLKLAAHLLLAFSLYGALLWTRWQVNDQPRLAAAPRGIALTARVLLTLLVLQLTFGALVAGWRAGLTYNTFPLMDGQFIPDGLSLLDPWWRNPLDNILTVQFQHRIGAMLLAVGILSFVAYAWKKTTEHQLLRALALTVCLQFMLGVATLLSHVEIALASLHQLVALLLTGLLVRAIYKFSWARS